MLPVRAVMQSHVTNAELTSFGRRGLNRPLATPESGRAMMENHAYERPFSDALRCTNPARIAECDREFLRRSAARCST